MTADFQICDVSGKVKHVTHSNAVMTRDRLQKRKWLSKFRSPPCDVYRCEHCHQYHIGNGDFTRVKGS